MRHLKRGDIELLNLEGKYTRLKCFTEEHLNDPSYLRWLRDYDVMKTIGRREYIDKQIEFDEVRKYVENKWNNEEFIFLALYHKKDNLFIGNVKIDIFNISTREADIGIMIGEKKCWGMGLATDAIRIVCKYCFETLHLRRLVSDCMAINVAMIKAFKRCGFVQEGLFRRVNYVEGEYIDQIHFSCFENELNTTI